MLFCCDRNTRILYKGKLLQKHPGSFKNAGQPQFLVALTEGVIVLSQDTQKGEEVEGDRENRRIQLDRLRDTVGWVEELHSHTSSDTLGKQIRTGD